jgi:predicted RNA methylase
MYFPKFYSEKQVIRTMRDIYKEQDCNSPHQYLTSDFQIEEGSIVVDCGVAEGNFALSVVDKVKKLYLVECDPAWIEALRQTFLPWKEKVIYVMKFISDVPDEMSTSIDTIVYPEAGEKYIIKLDIEGYEQKALKGMRRLVNSGNPIKMCVCTYHRPNDYSEIVSIIKKFGFTWHVSRSYLLFFQTDEKPSFRKVLIRAEK